MDAKGAGAGAARLHGVYPRQRAAHEATRLGLPPCIDNDRFALANDLVIPAPDFWLNRLAYGGHVLKMVVVLCWLVGTGLAEHANRCRSSVEDGHAEFLGNPPEPTSVGIGWHPFVHHARRPQ